MEDFIQKQADELFEKIDKQLFDFYVNQRLDYPDMILIHEAIAFSSKYPSHRNLIYINKLMNLLRNIEEEWNWLIGDSVNGKELSLFFLMGVPENCNTENDIQEYINMSNTVFSIAYSHISANITLEEYFKSFSNEVKPSETIYVKSEKDRITRIETYKNGLGTFGFFELEKVKLLSDEKKQELLNTLLNSKVPYKIAMLDYLEFINYLLRYHFTRKEDMYDTLTEILGGERTAVKKSWLSLNPKSKEKRYKAYVHKEEVQKRYNQLK